MPRHYPKRKQLLCQEQFEAETVAEMCLLASLHFSKRGMSPSTSATAARLRRMRSRNFLLLAAACLEAEDKHDMKVADARLALDDKRFKMELAKDKHDMKVADARLALDEKRFKMELAKHEADNLLSVALKIKEGNLTADDIAAAKNLVASL